MIESGSFHADKKIPKHTAAAFLTQEANMLYATLRPVMADTFYGNVNPEAHRLSEEYFESLLSHEINSPSSHADFVAASLTDSLTRSGVPVEQDILPYGTLGSYDGTTIYYSGELDGVLRANVVTHEAAHHLAGHTPYEDIDRGEEAIAEISAMLALRGFGIDTSSVSLPEISQYILQTAQTTGYQLWFPHYEEGLPSGLRTSLLVAQKIVEHIENGTLPHDFPRVYTHIERL